MQVRANIVKTSIPISFMEQVMRKIPFTVSFSMLLDETGQFADIVFPDLHYLERVGTGISRYRLFVSKRKYSLKVVRSKASSASSFQVCLPGRN